MQGPFPTIDRGTADILHNTNTVQEYVPTRFLLFSGQCMHESIKQKSNPLYCPVGIIKLQKL